MALAQGFTQVSPPPRDGLCFREADDLLESLCEEGGIGKNFYEIIRSSREFVKGMGSGRGEGGREDGMGIFCGGTKWLLCHQGISFGIVSYLSPSE